MDQTVGSPPAGLSAAEYDMKRQQTNSPPWRDLPWTPLDETRRSTPKDLIEMLPWQQRMAMHAAMQNRPFCAAEIGIAAPNAETQPYDDGSVFVCFNSGLIDFVYSVTRTLFGGSFLTNSQGETVPAVLGIGDVACRLDALYEQWRNGALWHNTRLQFSTLAIPSEQAKFAEHLARNVLLFFICHEIGHAVLHADVDADERNAAQEHEADAYGIELAILGYGRARRDERMAIAGATVAIRVLAALSALGHRFPGVHPLPVQRLARLRQAVRRMSGDDETYFHFTTIAYSFEEQMGAAELRILGAPGNTAVSAERLVSRCYAALEECARGRQPLGVFQSLFARDVAEAGLAVRARAGAILGRVLSTSSPSYQDPGNDRGRTYRNMVSNFREAVGALPVDLRPAFESEQQGGASHGGA